MSNISDQKPWTLWRKAAALITASAAAASIYATATPDVAAQQQAITPPPATEQTSASVPCGPDPVFKKKLFYDVSCVSPSTFKAIVGSPPPPDYFEQVKSKMPSIDGYQLVSMNKDAFGLPERAIAFVRDFNGLKEMYVLGTLLGNNNDSGHLYGFNPNPTAPDSPKNIDIPPNSTLFVEHLDPSKYKEREGNFSTYARVISNLIQFVTVEQHEAERQGLRQYLQVYQIALQKNSLTPEGRLDLEKFQPHERAYATQAQKYLLDNGWSILQRQPPIGLLPDNYGQQPARGVLPRLYLLGYPDGYIFVGSMLNFWPTRRFDPLVLDNFNRAYGTTREDIGQFSRTKTDPTKYDLVMKFSEALSLSAAPAARQDYAAPVATQQLSAASPSTARPATAQQVTPALPKTLSQDEINYILHARREAARASGLDNNKMQGLFQRKNGYTGPAPVGDYLILPEATEKEKQRFFACYTDPKCYAPVDGREHKDQGFQDPNTKEQKAKATPQSYKHGLKIIPEGKYAPELLQPFRKRQPPVALAHKKRPDANQIK